jgi:glycosyltransferase involved in cell wall biosynthesis
MTISALIITKNEVKNIRRCLESVKWCDEIIIVDCFSDDGTIDIVKEYTNKFVLVNAGFGKSRKIAFDLCTSDWILSIDADEMLSVPLIKEIKENIDNKEFDAYRMPSKLLILGNWHMYPRDHSNDVKLLRKSKAILFDSLVGEHYETSGKIGFLKNLYWHYQNETLSDRVTKLNRYSTLGSRDRKYKFTILKLLVYPIRFFIYDFILLGQIKYGISGYIYSTNKAFEKFLEVAKIYEMDVVKK